MDLDLSNEYYRQLEDGTDNGSVTSASSHESCNHFEGDDEELHHLKFTHEAVRKNAVEVVCMRVV